MSKQSVLILGDHPGDYESLQKVAKTQKTDVRWSCTKGTKKGDEIWIYIQAPISAVVVVGEAMKDAEPGERWPYVTRVRNIRWIENHITLDEMREAFPEWAWPKAARGKTYLEDDVAAWLRKRTTQAPAKEQARPVDRSIWIFGHGDKTEAGFDSPEALQHYIKDGIFDEFDRRYRYTEKQDPQTIVLSRDGFAYGHFEIEGTDEPNKKDKTEYPNVAKGGRGLSRQVIFSVP